MKINNVSLKGVKKFIDHEGYFIKKGNIYFGTKKVGCFEEDYYGGGTSIDIDENYLNQVKEASLRYAKAYPTGIMGIGLDAFTTEQLYKDRIEEAIITELCMMYEIEQDYKKYKKKGYAGIVLGRETKHSVELIWGINSQEDIDKIGKKYIISFAAKDDSAFEINV